MTRESKFSGRCRLVVTDIDCTFLTTRDKQLLPENLEAIRRLQAAGIHFAFATGRYLPCLSHVVEPWVLQGPQIVDNGATIGIYPDRILDSVLLPEKAVRLAYELGEVHGESTILCAPLVYYGYKFPPDIYESILRHRENPQMVGSREEMLSHAAECVKVGYYLKGSDAANQQFCQELNELMVSHGLNAYAIFTEKNILVLTAAGVNKLQGVKTLCGILGCTLAEVLAVGDGDNDVEMLAACGMGVCVANGTDLAKASATHLVGTNDEAGFAQAVNLVLK